MASQRRAVATLKYGSKYAFITFIALAHTVYTKMSGNTGLFGAAANLLATLATQLKDLDDVQGKVTRREPGATTLRAQKRDAVLSTLEALRALVQGLADASGDQAAVVIEAAGMKVKGAGKHQKPVLAASYGGQAGAVHLEVHAGSFGPSKRRRLYLWQHSLDGGKSFVDDPATPDARITIPGLPIHTEVCFRAMMRDTQEASDWTPIVTFLVR